MLKLKLTWLALVCLASAAWAQGFEQVELELVQKVSGRPLAVRHAGDGSGRVFIVKQDGVIEILHQGKLLKRPFLNIHDRIESGGEKGLLGLAFHPDFKKNGLFFVNYTYRKQRKLFTRVSRFGLMKDSPNDADPGSELVLMEFEQPYSNHNAGDIHFGPDGYLYISTGDGGAAGDPEDRARKLNNLLGKILRIDVDAKPAETSNACGLVARYAIPKSNPFAGKRRACGEIWSYGLRNPWRWSFDRKTGDLIIADVGQNKWEEVNFQLAASQGGEYYGWSCMEGRHRFKSNRCETRQKAIPPVIEYGHGNGDCSITGGYVYRGPVSGLQGQYVYGDYCSGRIWFARAVGQGEWTSRLWRDTDLNIASFGEDEAGKLWVVDHKGGLYRLEEKASP